MSGAERVPTGTAEPTVFLVDDDDAVRASVARFLGASGVNVQTFASAEQFLAEADRASPGCLLLDLRMPDLDGLELQELLGNEHYPHPIIFLTGHGSVPESVRAMKAGAVDFLEKPAEPPALLAAVRRALQRDAELRHEAAELDSLKRRLATLTPREREVFERVVIGRLNKQIAFELGVSEKTVKVHRGRVMEKMEAPSLADLARLAERLGIGSDAS